MNHEFLETCEICQKPARNKCGACRRIFYCSKEHQRDGWRSHKKRCKPFKVSESDVLGRFLRATRSLKPGEILIREPPVIWGPSCDSIPICLGCGKAVDEVNSRPCFKCGWPVCGEVCEKSPAHLPECRYTTQKVSIKKFGIPHPIYRCITVLRCLYQKQFLTKVWKKLDVLESHGEERMKCPGYENERIAVSEFIRRFFKLSSVFSEEEIMRVSGIVTVNCHEVPLTEPPHIAIYSTASFLEHSCIPNCSKTFTSDGQIVIAAAQPIQEGDHLSICYADALWGTPNRRHFLHETKFFWCNCPRCEDPTEFSTFFSALKCKDATCKGLVLPEQFTQTKLSDWKCNVCSKNLSSYSVHDILDRIGRDLNEIDKKNREECKNFFKTYEGYLPENHFYFTELKYELSQNLGHENGLEGLSNDDLQLKLKLCRDLKELVNVLAPAERRTLGMILFEMHAASAEVARRTGAFSMEEVHGDLTECRKYLVETIEILKNEPEVLAEGKVCRQAQENLRKIDVMLGNVKS